MVDSAFVGGLCQSFSLGPGIMRSRCASWSLSISLWPLGDEVALLPPSSALARSFACSEFKFALFAFLLL